ncbi:MAG: cobalamin-dependent protein, partial [Candidatus Methylomirabilis sp.]|nr:cobalamin-dependent protein [Deltaproteobacteria bacterium]
MKGLYPTERCDALLVQAPNVVGTMFNLPGVETPLNLCYIASYLEKEGGRAEVFDGALFGDWRAPFEACLRATRPALLGFASYTPNVMHAADMAAFAKKVLPGVVTVIGGFHASALPERTLREFPSFDYLIAGEPLHFLRVALGQLQREGREGDFALAGLTYREGDRITANRAPPLLDDLDVLPWPAREKLPLAR